MSSINEHKLKITEKTEHIIALHQAYSDPLVISMRKLLSLLISERREDNDSVSRMNLQKNQGEIRGYKTLLDYIEKGIPATPFNK